jgi:SAM-dependent methyltransferase
MSNLPTRAHREATYRLAARSLRPGGRFVYSTHHHSIRDRLTGKPKSGHYRKGGIYRYQFSLRECVEEASAHFRTVRARPLRVYLPLSRRLRMPLELQSRIGERIPIVRGLAQLVLCSASDPRPPVAHAGKT